VVTMILVKYVMKNPNITPREIINLVDKKFSLKLLIVELRELKKELRSRYLRMLKRATPMFLL